MADIEMGKNNADLSNNMDSSSENGMETDQEVAEAKKTEGNELYKRQEYSQAIECYSQAINMCPMCASYYNNRAAAFMMLDKYQQALEDVQEALRLNNKLVKGYIREAKCHIALGSADAAIRSLERLADVEPSNKQAESEMRTAKLVQLHDLAAEKAFSDGDFRKVVYDMDRAIDRAPASSRFKIRRAEALAKLKRFSEAQETINGLLLRDPMNADALYVRGLCLYYQDSIEKAQQHFQQVLRLAPDHKIAITAFKKCKLLKNKKDQGNDAFKAGQYQAAYDLYTEALSIDPHNVNTNAKLYCNRATVGSKLKRLEESIRDCTSAIELDENYLKAYMRRAKCYYDTELFEEAVRDYEKIYNMDKTRENKRVLQDAKLELKKSKRKDYYKVLSIQKVASEDEIKKAYRKHALLHHPDRHASKSAEERKEEEIKFKEVNEAYSILSDTKKRYRYDSGQDLEEMEGFSGFDPNQIFQTFFGGPGFQFGGHDRGHGFPGGSNFSSGGGGGFPGGFHFQFS